MIKTQLLLSILRISPAFLVRITSSHANISATPVRIAVPRFEPRSPTPSLPNIVVRLANKAEPIARMNQPDDFVSAEACDITPDVFVLGEGFISIIRKIPSASIERENSFSIPTVS